MKITWKTKKRPSVACPCHDPLVFGHAPPCPQWESRNNDGPPMPPGPPLTEGFDSIRIHAAVTETVRAMHRLGRTTEDFNALMRETIDASEARDLSSPPGPPGGTA